MGAVWAVLAGTVDREQEGPAERWEGRIATQHEVVLSQVRVILKN